MRVPHTALALFSLLFLATVLTFVMALNEQDEWAAIWRETRRRWLKLVGILAVIALATMGLTIASDLL